MAWPELSRRVRAVGVPPVGVQPVGVLAERVQPGAYAPSVFSPSVFSPSVFSPSVFSPSVFSPSVFSPSVFSPSVFSPSVFSPSVFSPQRVLAVGLLAVGLQRRRCRPGVLERPDSQPHRRVGDRRHGDETVVVNTWNNTGALYVRVAGHGGAFDTERPVHVDVTKSPSTCGNLTDTSSTANARSPRTRGNTRPSILTDSSKLALGDAERATPCSASSRRSRVGRRSTARSSISTDDPVITALRAQVAANIGCPFAVNLLAEEIKSIVDSYRTPQPPTPRRRAEALRYVTIIGDDTVIPFFRYPDQSLLGQESGYFPPVNSNSISEASLRHDFVLSQDAYGSGVSVDIRTRDLPGPGPRGRSAGRDAERDRRHARRLHGRSMGSWHRRPRS